MLRPDLGALVRDVPHHIHNHGRAVVMVLPGQAGGEFVGLRFSEHACPSVEQALHGVRGAQGRSLQGEPLWVAKARATPLDRIDILAAALQPRPGSGGRACHLHRVLVTKNRRQILLAEVTQRPAIQRARPADCARATKIARQSGIAEQRRRVG